MPDIHDRGRALAIRMLAPRPQGKGLGLVLRQKNVGEYNPETGGQDVTWDEYMGSGLRTSFDLQDIDNTYILEGDVEILVSPVLVDRVTDMPQPSTNDVIDFDGSSYNVIGVRPGDYAGVNCFYKAHCRGL